MARLRPIVDARSASSLPLELKAHALKFLATDNLVHPAAVSKAWRAATMMDDRFVLQASIGIQKKEYHNNSQLPFFDVIEHAIRFGRRLSITFNTYWIDCTAPQDFYAQTLRVEIEAVARAMHLVTRLNITGNNGLPDGLLRACFQAEAPALRSLRISSSSFQEIIRVPPMLFSGHAPRLESVKLFHAVLAEPVPAFRTARLLHIYYESRSILPPRPFELHDTFPSLRRLSFNVNDFDERDTSPEENVNIEGLQLNELYMTVSCRASHVEEAGDLAAHRLAHISSVSRGMYREINHDTMRQLLNTVGSGSLSLNVSQVELDSVCVALIDITGLRRAVVIECHRLSDLIYDLCPRELTERLTTLIIECDHAYILNRLPELPGLLQLDIRASGHWDRWNGDDSASEGGSSSEEMLSEDDLSRDESDIFESHSASLEGRTVDIQEDASMPTASFPALDLVRIVAVDGQCNVSIAVIRCLAEGVNGRRCRLELYGVIGIANVLSRYRFFKAVEVFPERISPLDAHLEHTV
ncbi:hypothetical protein BKA62DRAFT_42550 [Auriculariales sp. MPI-PUGE-AT-0066]|nr:hypothetical protein BKA62DRAFT_42550 [Auriculariales sp. MPI-PUGE-AT-0066]